MLSTSAAASGRPGSLFLVQSLQKDSVELRSAVGGEAVTCQASGREARTFLDALAGRSAAVSSPFGRLRDAVAAVDREAAVEKAWIPVPAPAAVGMEPQVLLQPLGRARPRPVRQIGGDRVGRLLDRGEPDARVGAHEALHLGDAGEIDPRRDVDQHQCGEHRRPAGRLRIARGSGTNVQAVNQLVKQFGQMRKVMRQVGRGKMPDLGALMRQAR